MSILEKSTGEYKLKQLHVTHVCLINETITAGTGSVLHDRSKIKE